VAIEVRIHVGADIVGAGVFGFPRRSGSVVSIGGEADLEQTHGYERNLMNAAQALHHAARRYCQEKHEYWCKHYSMLPNSGRFRGDYSKKALAIFPRYNVLNAILVELERTDPATLLDFDQARELIIAAGTDAEDEFTSNEADAIQARVTLEERQEFCSYISGLEELDLWSVRPLPYRRVLRGDESEGLWVQLRERWRIPLGGSVDAQKRGWIRGGYWVPLTEFEIRGVTAFQARYFHQFWSSSAARDLLSRRGIDRVWELREYGPEYEEDLSVFDPYYNGAEGYWSSGGLDWIIYASHESSVTVGGWLLEEVKNIWSDWNSRIWTSPFY
jgi:hypothetical protein